MIAEKDRLQTVDEMDCVQNYTVSIKGIHLAWIKGFHNEATI